MSRIIIGIHGLGNKPSQDLLTRWWKKSIHEGLKSINSNRFTINFDLVYWADVLYDKPLSLKKKDENHPLYLDDPYTPANSAIKKTPDEWKVKIVDYIDKQIDKLFLNKDMSLNYSAITDKIIHHYFRDLEVYYSASSVGQSNQPARDVIRERLANTLIKHKRKKIMLIAHSMGSIIAYDVLNFIVPEIKIDTFVTIGSPLGLPVIVSKIYGEQNKDHKKITKVKTPESIINSWINLSDPDDKVALDHTLADDYEKNTNQVRAIDKYIYNNYEISGKRNPHKSYGYLRSPELAEIIDLFLVKRRIAWIGKFVEKYNFLRTYFRKS